MAIINVLVLPDSIYTPIPCLPSAHQHLTVSLYSGPRDTAAHPAVQDPLLRYLPVRSASSPLPATSARLCPLALEVISFLDRLYAPSLGMSPCTRQHFHICGNISEVFACMS
jgi:hypothetical protein